MSRVPFSYSLELREDIGSRITKKIDGMFLLVRHYLDLLIRKGSPRAIKAALEMLPMGIEGYDNEYMDAMERIGREIAVSRDLAKQVLSWITCAKRPLTTSELQYALAVRIGNPELDEDSLPEVEDMVSFCAGLVTINVASDTIRFIHYTAQEYFIRTQGSWFPTAQTDITGICVTYLSFDAFGAGPCAADEEFIARLRLNPLYDYAARNWGRHAHEMSAQVEKLTLDLENDAKVAAAS
ncbi:MAG: hypothetical protein M1840_005880 [Geoglossum simile]|nr:MAG: hypothetical protein M1840_005880 [Geoglossum simile]